MPMPSAELLTCRLITAANAAFSLPPDLPTVAVTLAKVTGSCASRSLTLLPNSAAASALCHMNLLAHHRKSPCHRWTPPFAPPSLPMPLCGVAACLDLLCHQMQGPISCHWRRNRLRFCNGPVRRQNGKRQNRLRFASWPAGAKADTASALPC